MPVIKTSLTLALFFTSLLLIFPFTSVSTASASEIVIDTEHHHLGDNFKDELNPKNPEGLIYTENFILDPSADIESAEFKLTGRSVVPRSTD